MLLMPAIRAMRPPKKRTGGTAPRTRALKWIHQRIDEENASDHGDQATEDCQEFAHG